jgi:hypothetical protein
MDAYDPALNGEPQFKHDCKKCKFISNHVIDRKLVDVYYCGHLTDMLNLSVIVRQSSEPEDNMSCNLEILLNSTNDSDLTRIAKHYFKITAVKINY